MSSTNSVPSQRRSLLRFVPALESLTTYTPLAFRRDLVAGLTVAAVAVPQAMAYASIFGMPVQMGLYTAIIMTGVGALFASSKQLINGPTNAISIAMLSALAIIPEGQREMAAVLMAAFIGIIQTGITLLRLGDLSRFISQSVVVGFTAGASVLLVLDQLKNLLGLKAQGSHDDHFIVRFYLTLTEGGPVHWPTVCVALGTIGIALIVRWINGLTKWRLPELLLAIAVAAFAAWAFDLGGARWGVRLVDKIPLGKSLPTFEIPAWNWTYVRDLAPSALAVALLGLLEAIAMAKSIAMKTRQKLDINQQCLSEGLANIAGSFFHCFPGSGSLTRSYINFQAGAVTEWSGIFAAAAVAVTAAVFAPLAEYIPRPALAGVLMLTATRMIDPEALRYHMKATRFDALIVIATACAAIFVSVEFCILVGVLLAFAFYVPKAARLHVTELIATEKGVVRERWEKDPPCAKLRIVNFEGELFFGASPAFEEALEKIDAEVADDAVVILRMRYVRNLDAVCLHVLHDFVERMQEAGRVILLSGIRDDVYAAMENVGLVDDLGKDNIFREVPQVWSSTLQAIQAAYDRIGPDRCHDCPRAKSPIDPTSDWSFMI